MSAIRADQKRLSAFNQRSRERYVLLTSIFVFRYLWLIFFTVSSFFLSPRQIFSSLPSVVTWLVPQSKICVAPTVSPIPVKNIQRFIEYLCGLEKTRKKGSNSTLLFRKACLRLLGENNDNRNATTKQVLNWRGRMNAYCILIFERAFLSETAHPLATSRANRHVVIRLLRTTSALILYEKNGFQHLILKKIFGCAEIDFEIIG